MKWYPWLRPDFEQLIASYQAGRGHHALMIQALRGMGEDALIYAIVRYLMCQTPQDHKSCGRCHSCQLMQAGTHPDYYVMAPEKGKVTLGVDAVRDICEKMYEHARLGGAKVVWIQDAELLTDAAANALLKTLEEPPANSWFFLACREPARLLATLRSRCRWHHLAPPAESYALAWLAREVPAMTGDAQLTALRLCGGSPGAAEALLTAGGWSQRLQLCQALDGTLASGDWLALLPALNHDNAAERLHWLASLLLDAIKARQGITLLTNADAVSLVNRLAQQLSDTLLRLMMRQACEHREQLLNVSGLNRELILTEQLLNWEHYLQPGAVLPVSHL